MGPGFRGQVTVHSGEVADALGCNQIAASVYDKYSVGPSIRPIRKHVLKNKNMIQACSNFR